MPDTEFDAPPITAPVSLERTSVLEQEGPASEIYQHEDARVAFGMDPVDGLPRPVVESSFERQQVVPLSPHTFVCMADRSSFVLYIPQDGEFYEAALFEPHEVVQVAGVYYVTSKLAIARACLRPMPEDQLRALHQLWTELKRVVVRPIREQCKHYVRQLVDFPADPDHQLMTRMCTAQRSETGEYVSVREALMYACELREPRDIESEKKLDEFDDNKIRLGLLRTNATKKFDVDAELAAEASSDPSNGGIFTE